SEFELFELAYLDWFGDDPAVSQVEPTFATYMFNGDIPAWVRQYARKVLKTWPEDLRAPLAIPRRVSPLRGTAYFMLIVFVVGALFLSSASTADLLPAMQQCYFPPCY
ncbi:MAG: hypothetical protein PVH98_01180, partial [Gammaproteobacteria bacterium]